MQRDHTARFVVSVALAVFGAATGGCGSEEQSAPTAEKSPQAVSDTPKRQIANVVRDVQAAFLAGHAKAFCSILTPSGQAEVARFARDLGQGSTCQQFVRRSYRASKGVDLEQKPTKLLSVQIRGDRATAMVSNGGRPPTPLRFVKQGGDWKLPSAEFSSGTQR